MEKGLPQRYIWLNTVHLGSSYTKTSQKFLLTVGIGDKNPLNIEPSGLFIVKVKMRAVNSLYPFKINNLCEIQILA